MNLTPEQKLICIRVVNVFETGSIIGDYGNISIYKDGPGGMRQITFGRSQTTEYGNLAELVQMYASAGGEYSASLAPYVSKIGKTPLVDNASFKSLLQKAGREDPVMQSTQDAFFDKRYFNPAIKWAEEHGFILPLSALVIYDSFIHSGGILDFLRNAFPEKVPSAGGTEKTWISKYVQARAHWLATSSKTILHATVYRTQCFSAEINRGNWDLKQLPIFAHGVRVDDAPTAGAAKPTSAPVATVAPSQISLSSVTPTSNPVPKEPSMTAITASMPVASGSIGSFFVNLLNSSQLQSLGRTFAKVGGLLLVYKYGIDPTNLASIVGGVVAAGGVLSSIKAHANAPASQATPNIPIADVVSSAVQSAAQAAVSAVLTSLLPAQSVSNGPSSLTEGTTPANPTLPGNPTPQVAAS